MSDDNADYDYTSILGKIYNNIFYVVENYGWYILLGLILIAIIYNKYVKCYVEKYRAYWFEKEYAAKYHKNPDLFAAHITAQQQYVEKLQEKYKKDAEEKLKKLEMREQKKREEFLEKTDNSKVGQKLGRPNDYNPLMGAGSSGNYRPKKKSPCGSGGCGK